jgi:ribonuclease P protein component
MFSKKYRLNSQDFDEVFGGGQKVFNKNFLLKHKDNNWGHSRFAVAVPKKQIKSAIKRHLLKRRFFAAIKETNFDEFNKDFVFILNQSLLSVEYNDLTEGLKELKNKLNK